MSLVWLTISKALVRSIVLVNVWSGGQGLLKPWVILCARGRMADMVEWVGRKPCWLGERGNELRSGCTWRSKTLVIVILSLKKRV